MGSPCFFYCEYYQLGKHHCATYHRLHLHVIKGKIAFDLLNFGVFLESHPFMVFVITLSFVDD